MKKQLMALVLASAAVLSGCTSQPTVTRPLPAVRAAKISLVYQSNRYGVLEPCGCESKPYGGIDREANALEGMRKEKGTAVLYVDAGNMLAPRDVAKRLAHHREKAKTIAHILGQMGLEVFAPGPTDYALGASFLKSLVSENKGLKVVSTNVLSSDSPVFSPYAIVTKKGVRFAFLSLTPPGSLDDKQLTVEEPQKALDRWLPEVSSKSDFVIVFSQLGTQKDEAMAAKYPQVQVIVGGDPEFSFEEPLWFQGKTIIVDPHINGYLLGRLDLNLQLPLEGLYSESAIKSNRAKLALWNAKLAKDPGNKLAAQYVKRISAEDCLAPIPEGTAYHNQLIELDRAHYGATNAISKLVAQEKERVRQRALQGE